MATDDQILEAIQGTNLELVKIGGAVKTSADGIAELLRRGETTNRRNGWQTVALFIAVLGMTFTPLAFAIKGVAGSLERHDLMSGHEGMDGRVVGIEKKLHGEKERNDRVDAQLVELRNNATKWRGDHDRRVLPLNTAQSKKGEELGRLQEVLWHNCMPPEMGPYPRDVSGWPRIEP